MIYVRAGVYAEGPTDYDFLLPLLDRLLDDIAARLFPGAYEVATTAGIDAPRGAAGARSVRVAAAVEANWDACTVFVIHADGGGDPDAARGTNIEPGLAAARAAHPDRTVAAAACVPVREIEAWLLADPEVFHAILGAGAGVTCPPDPERLLDPKATLRGILKRGGARRPPERMYAFFGERVRFDRLRGLSAFEAFEAELVAALQDLGRPR